MSALTVLGLVMQLAAPLSTERPGNGENAAILEHGVQLETGYTRAAGQSSAELKLRAAVLPRLEAQVIHTSTNYGFRAKVNLLGLGIAGGWFLDEYGETSGTTTVTAGIGAWGLTVVRGGTELNALSYGVPLYKTLSLMLEGSQLDGVHRFGAAGILRLGNSFQVDVGVDVGRGPERTYVGSSVRF